MLEPPENPPPQPANPEIERLLAQLQRMNAEQVIEELKSVKDEAREIKRTVDQNEEALKMHGDKLPDAVMENGPTLNRLNNITDVVKRTLMAIKSGMVNENTLVGVPKRSRDIIISLCTETPIGEVLTVDNKNSLFINEIIIRGIEGKLETVPDLISVFENIRMIYYTDYNMYTEIADLLRNKAQERGANKGQLEKLMTEEQKKDKNTVVSKEMEKAYQQMVEQLNDDITNSRLKLGIIIDGLTSASVGTSRIGEEIRKRHISPEEQNRLIEEEVKKLRTQMTIAINNLNNTSGSSLDLSRMAKAGATPKQMAEAVIEANTINSQITNGSLSANFAGLDRLVDSLGGPGGQAVLSSTDYEEFKKEINLMRRNSEALMTIREKIANENQGKGRFYAMVTSYVTTWSPKDKELLAVLDDPEEGFIQLVKRRYDKDNPGGKLGYNGFETSEDWERFRHDIKNLFDTMFAGTASNPKDFFQSTYSELKEGMVYKELTTALLKLGEDLKKDREFGEHSPKKYVEIKDIYARYETQAYEGSRMGGGSTLTADKKVKDCLGKGIRALTYEMIDYKELTQHSHDTNALVESGLGFDKLDEFSARLRQEDVDRLIKGMPGLSDAIQFYHTDIGQITAEAFRNIPVEFGRRAISFYNLDVTGRRVFLKLKNLSKIKERVKKGELDENNIAQMVSFASGLSKGDLGGFFGVSGNNHIAVEVVEDEMKDPKKTDDCRPHWKTRIDGKSNSDRGVESMIASADPDYIFIKFGRPREYQFIRYAYSPRDLFAEKPPKGDYGRNHGKIQEYYNMGEEAIVNGACNEYLDFIQEHAFLKDTMKVLILDLGERSGWRHYDYKKKLFYLDLDPNSTKETRNIDFHKTIARLQGVGEEAIRVFIEDLFRGEGDYRMDVSGVALEDLAQDIFRENEEYLKSFGWKPGEKIEGKTRKALKELFYEKYVFQQIRRTHPSLFIAMETREYMPEDEVRGTRKSKREIERIKNEKERRCEEKRRRGEEIKPKDKFGPEDTYEKGFTFHDQLTDYLFDKYKDNHSREWIKTFLLPMYVDALQMTEKNEWHVHYYEEWKKNEENGVCDPTNDPFNYRFTEEAFERHRDSLISFYVDERQKIIGISKEGGISESMEDEKFVENLKGFYRRMEEVIEHERWDRSTTQNKSGDWVHRGNRVTLTQRYARLLVNNMAGVGTYISNGCLNYDEFSFQTSGSRMTQRATQEMAVWVKNGAPNVSSIIIDKLYQVVRTKVNNDKEFEELLDKSFGEALSHIYDATRNIDEAIGWEYCGHFLMALDTAMRDDRIFAIGGIGPIVKGWLRRWDKRQSSLVTDAIPETDREGVTTLDTTNRRDIFFRHLGEIIHLNREKEQVVGHGPSKFFGLIPGKNIYRKNPFLSIEHLTDLAQTGIKTRLKENVLMPVPILLMILAMLAKLAFDKDKQK